MFRVQGLGFRVQGSGFRVQGLGFRVQGVGFRVPQTSTEPYRELFDLDAGYVKLDLSLGEGRLFMSC